MSKVHLIMPMGGAGSRFFKDGYVMPKPLIEIKGKPFLYWATMSIKKYIDLEDITFVILQEHVDKFQIDKEILKYFPDAKFVILKEMFKEGPVLTCRAGVSNINDDKPIIFNDCDHCFKSTSFNAFCKDIDTNVDGALLTFKADDPKFSYLELDDNKNVIRTVEKEVISNDAICGAYYVRNKKIFLDSIEEYMNNCNYKELFVSGIYNIMIKNNLTVKNFELDFHITFGTPSEYEEAKERVEFEEF